MNAFYITFEEYYQKTQKIFDRIEVSYLKRRAYLNQKKPFPIFGNADKHFTARVKEKGTEGFLFFKKGYEWLQRPENWTIIKPDVSVSPSAILNFYGGKFFFQRDYLLDNIIENNSLRFENLWQLTKIKFKHVKFEEIIGLFTDKNDTFESLLFHTYSGGIPLDKITQKTPKIIRDYLHNLVIDAFSELNNKGFEYTECQPTNIRYDSKNKIILNPHNCIRFPRERLNEISDLACLLYTNDWMGHDAEKICKKYLGVKVIDKEYKKFLGHIYDQLECLENGDISQITQWQRRGVFDIVRKV